MFICIMATSLMPLYELKTQLVAIKQNIFIQNVSQIEITDQKVQMLENNIYFSTFQTILNLNEEKNEEGNPFESLVRTASSP